MHERVHRFIQQIRTMREEVNRKLDALKHQVVLRFTSEDAFERPQKRIMIFPRRWSISDRCSRISWRTSLFFSPQTGDSPVRCPRVCETG